MERQRTPRSAQAKKKRAAGAKKRREIVRKRVILLGILIAAAAALIVFLICRLTGVFESIPERSVLHVGADGQVVCEEVTTFDETFYTKSSLKSFMKKEIGAYNDENGSGSVKLEQVKVKGDTAYARTAYTSPNVYSSFTGFGLYQGTVKQALKDGYDFSDAFVSVENGEKKEQAETLDITSQPKLNVVAVRENIEVTVDGEILYVSDSNTTMVDASTVSIEQLDGNNDATQLTYIVYKKTAKSEK